MEGKKLDLKIKQEYNLNELFGKQLPNEKWEFFGNDSENPWKIFFAKVGKDEELGNYAIVLYINSFNLSLFSRTCFYEFEKDFIPFSIDTIRKAYVKDDLIN